MANTTNFNWATPDDTDLVKDGAAAIRTLGSSIDTSLVDLKGGTTGQILSKASNTDMDFAFITPNVGDITEVQAGVGISIASGTGPIPVITNSSTDLITTAGDILYGTAADTVARLGIGAAGRVLKVNSGATAPEWAVDPTTDVVTTAGDLIYGTGADAVTRLGIGTAGQVLKVNSGATAPEWGAASAPSFVGCVVRPSAGQSISNDTVTAVTCATEEIDTDGFHSTSVNTARITIPVGKAGKYQVSARMCYQSNVTGIRALFIYKNANSVARVDMKTGESGTVFTGQAVWIGSLAEGDYVEINTYQNSGGSLNTEPGTGDTINFAAVFLGA
jgi:hypothetical protein